MTDVTAKGKLVFWVMILAVLLFSTVPSIMLIKKGKEYYSFLTGWTPKSLKPTATSRIPPPPDSMTDGMPDIHFVEFQIEAPGAKSVFLSANFNGWKPDSLALKQDTAAKWKIVVPLPPGRYYYGFEVDGSWRTDSNAAGDAQREGRKVSVIMVP